ncbi:hypothetical protein ILYODFUR_006875 [Ilyodon furcidens]|uniref:Uncharacterized protein n=1 Tax=Ilyodon furcidens TaxID=33524 RepID=A0ABV0TWR9_9TELE
MYSTVSLSSAEWCKVKNLKKGTSNSLKSGPEKKTTRELPERKHARDKRQEPSLLKLCSKWTYFQQSEKPTFH